MLAYIYHKTIWKYNTTNDDYSIIMINNIINKGKTSELNYLYKKNLNEISYEQKYINKLYNLYQSIKLLIKITESNNNNISIYHPKLLNKHFNKYYSKNLESQKKIKVKRLSKNVKNENKNNDIKMDISLSSIKITIDLDEKDNYQNGCPDFATGNEMYYLLKNIKQSPSDCLYNNYFRNCNIYKKKKSPQVSFRIFSPKNRRFFGENKFFDNPIKNNMINNNIFINNNNYNNHTNFFINDYNINENINNNNNSKEKNLIIKKRYHHIGNYKYQTHTHIIPSSLNNRNRLFIPQSQSCEKFIYKKKYISSKAKEQRNKTAEEFEKDTQKKEKEENEIYNENNLNDIQIKYIPLIHKNSNIKILENLDNNNDDDDADDKTQKIEKINYIGRNDFNTNKESQNKYPFLLSRIIKNCKTNRKPSLTQEEYITKFNSTFNLNVQNNYKTKRIKPNKSKIEDYISNNKNNNLKKIKKVNNENNTLLTLNNKKEKTVVKRKETNLKFKKNNTSKFNLSTTNTNNILKEKILNFGKKIKKEKKLEKDKKLQKEKKEKEKIEKIEKKSKDLKKRIKEEKKSKPINLLNPKRFNSPIFNRDSLTHIIFPDHLTCKNRTKRISFKELLNKRISIDFSNMNKSNTYLNYDLNKFDSTKVKNKNLLSSKSIGYIHSISRQLFSPTKRDSITANKISFVNNEKYIDNYYDTNNCIYNEENLNNSYFKTLPTKKEENEKTIVLSKSENNKLILNKFVTKKNKLKEIPIKVNLNRNSITKISHRKLSTLNKNNYKTEKTLESNKILTTRKNNSLKRKFGLEKDKKNNKNIKIELNSFQ